IDARRYVFGTDGHPVLDPARDRQYTRELGTAIIEGLHRNNAILPTHLMCFAIMQALAEQSGERDLYRMLRSRHVTDGLDAADIMGRRERLPGVIGQKGQPGHGEPCPVWEGDADRIVAAAEGTLGLYHAPPPVERRGDRIYVRQPALVYYYRNRLAGYG